MKFSKREVLESGMNIITLKNEKGKMAHELIFTEHPDYVYIEHAYTEQSERKKGYTKKAILRMLEFCPAATIIRLTCTPSSKRIWKHLGFTFKGDYGEILVETFKNQHNNEQNG